MKKNEFLDKLKEYLSLLPEDERDAQLSYYNELICDMTEDGIPEEDATARLGTPERLAARCVITRKWRSPAKTAC